MGGGGAQLDFDLIFIQYLFFGVSYLGNCLFVCLLTLESGNED